MRCLAIFLPDLHGGGAERMMVNLASGVADRGWRVELVLANAVGPYLAEVPRSVRLTDLGCRSTSSAIPKLALFLRRRRPDVLLSTLPHASVAAAVARALAGSRELLFLREANTVSTLHATFPSRKSRVLASLVRWAYARSTGVLAVSEGVASDLVRAYGVPPAKVTTVYSPVVTPSIAANALEDPHHPWFGHDMPPVVLGVGSLTVRKDFATLIDAFALLRRTRPARLIILGEGPLREELECRVREHGIAEDVQFPGFVENPFAFMARAAVFVLSSIVEGLPGVLIQALACGCPVVATDCPSGPGEILLGGRVAPLVPMGAPVALADAIQRVLEAPPDRQALVRRADDFAASRVVDAHVELMERALNAGPRPPSQCTIIEGAKHG